MLWRKNVATWCPRFSKIYEEKNNNKITSLMNHPHSIGRNEPGQVGNEAALSFLSMWVGVLDRRCFFMP